MLNVRGWLGLEGAVGGLAASPRITTLRAAAILLLYTLVALGMAATGGWESALRPLVALAVVVSAVILPKQVAFALAAPAALTLVSAGLYESDGNIPVAFAGALPAYALIVWIVATGRESAVRLVATTSEQRLRDLVALQRTAAIVGSHLSTDDAIAAILSELQGTFGHELISVYLREGDALVMQAQVGYSAPYEVIPLGVGVCGEVGATGHTVFISDVRHDSTYRPAVEGVASEICVPLREGNATIGILNVESRRTLSEADRELLELFGGQVSVVLANARVAEDLRQRARHDGLTGLLNHRTLMEELDRAIAGGVAAVLLLDLDHFKAINDTHGHLTGDALLVHLAGILRANCREGDVAGRLGGDEFLLVLPGADRDSAEVVRQRIMGATEAQPFLHAGGLLRPSFSIGIAVAWEDGTARDALLDRADARMYREKSRRRARA